MGVTRPPLILWGRLRRAQVAWRRDMTQCHAPPYVEGVVRAGSLPAQRTLAAQRALFP